MNYGGNFKNLNEFVRERGWVEKRRLAVEKNRN